MPTGLVSDAAHHDGTGEHGQNAVPDDEHRAFVRPGGDQADHYRSDRGASTDHHADSCTSSQQGGNEEPQYGGEQRDDMHHLHCEPSFEPLGHLLRGVGIVPGGGVVLLERHVSRLLSLSRGRATLFEYLIIL